MRSRGNTSPRGIGSTLPAEYPPRECQDQVQVVNGFFLNLPEQSRLFFQRIYFTQVPRPIQRVPGNAFPRTLNIITIQAPERQAIVLRAVRFFAWQASGIGIADVVGLDPLRLTGTVGFRFLVGNQGMTDYDTNLSPALAGSGLAAAPFGGGQQFVPPFGNQPARSGGNLSPFAGTVTPKVCGENFATYVRPADQLKADAVILRQPNIDLRLFAVQLSGWIVDADQLDKILSNLWGKTK